MPWEWWAFVLIQLALWSFFLYGEWLEDQRFRRMMQRLDQLTQLIQRLEARHAFDAISPSESRD
jgi:hypothetical protein